MNLQKKKTLAAKTLNVGRERILFNTERIAEIKEAITRQDIRDLYENKSILIKNVHGRRTKVKRNTRRRFGSIKKKVDQSKQDYVILTRKLRNYLNELRKQNKLSTEQFKKLRTQLKTGMYRSKGHIKEYILTLTK
jgi:large subunit ribosomal protein L19e